MKSLLTLLCSVALATAATAQPYVFTYENGPKNPNGIDTMYGTVLNSVPSVTDGQWQSWDLSATVLAGYRYYSAFSAVSNFTGATNSNLAYVDISPGVKYQTQFMISIDTTGIKTVGERLARQAFGIGNPGDSLVVKAQDVTYSSPMVRMPYPCKMGTKWNSAATAVYDMSITASPLYNNTPAQRKTMYVSTCEVIGWGDMKIKRTDGRPSGQRPVLEVKMTLSTTDSFFVNGMAAPASLLAQAGIQQGETRIVYQKTFFREYEMMPLTNITFETATFAKMKDVTMHAQRVPYPDNVSDVSVSVAEIYPNPNKGTFSVNVPDADAGAWSYTVMDMTGKQVSAGVLNIGKGQNKAQVALSGVLTPGSYIVNIAHNGNDVCGKKVLVQ